MIIIRRMIEIIAALRERHLAKVRRQRWRRFFTLVLTVAAFAGGVYVGIHRESIVETVGDWMEENLGFRPFRG